MQSQWKTVWKFFKDLIGRPYDPAFQIWVFIKEYKNTNLKRYVCASQLCLTLCDPMDTRLLHPWDFLGKSTRVGCHFLLQGIFLTQGSNPGLPHCRQTLYHLSHQGSPKACEILTTQNKKLLQNVTRDSSYNIPHCPS